MVKNGGQSGDTTHSTHLTLGEVSPWMGEWASSTAHSATHWLLLLMELIGGYQIFR